MFDYGETIFYGKDSYYNDPQNRILKQGPNVGSKSNRSQDERRSEFYDKIRFLLVQLVLFGILPVCKPGPRFKTRFCLVVIYCIPVYTILTTLCWFEFKAVYKEIRESSTLEGSVALMKRLIFLSQQFSFVFCFWSQSYYMIRNFRHWSEYQEQYEGLTLKPFKLNKINGCIAFSIFNFFVLTPLVWFYYRNVNIGQRYGYWHIYLYCYVNQSLIILVEIFYFIARAGEIVADDFLQQLKQKCSRMISPSELQDYRLLWLKLSEVVCGAGAAISIPIVQLIISTFIFMVVYSYLIVLNAITTLQHNNSDSNNIIVNSLLAQTLIIFCCLLICQKGYDVSKKNQLIKRYLMGVQFPKTHLNQAAIAEVRIFIRSVEAFPLEFSIRGFKVVNKAMFASIIGDVVTYVIILVQFNLSLQSPSPNPSQHTTNNYTVGPQRG